MKRRGVFLVVLALVLISLISLVYAAPSVTITASPKTVQINDIITLTVIASDNTGLNTISAKPITTFLDYNCNSVTSCSNKWYTSVPGATSQKTYEAKACNTNGECTETFATVSVISQDSDDQPIIQDKSVSPSKLDKDQIKIIFDNIKKIIKKKINANIIYENQKAKEIAPFELELFKEFDKKQFKTFNESIDYYFLHEYEEPKQKTENEKEKVK